MTVEPEFVCSGSDGVYAVMERKAWDRHCAEVHDFDTETPRDQRTYKDRWQRWNPWRKLKLWLWYNGYLDRLNLHDPENPGLPIVWFRVKDKEN